MLHTTFNKLRKASACKDSYKKFAKHLGGVTKYGRNTPIPLTVVLDSNGFDDAAWCLRATVEPVDAFARDFACDCAEMVSVLLADQRSRDAITVSRRHARGLASYGELAAARDAAWAAAAAAAWAAAAAAARAAAGAAAGAAAWAAAAAGDAAGDAARAAAIEQVSKRFRERLEAHSDANELGEVSTPIVSLI